MAEKYAVELPLPGNETKDNNNNATIQFISQNKQG